MTLIRSQWLLTVLLAVGASAQDLASITGQVLDSSTAAVAGAVVTISNVGTGSRFTATSDRSGFYRVPQIAPGEYTITASAPGFRTVVQEGIVIRVGDRLRVDLNVEVGQVNEQITVKASAAQLQAEDAVVGQVIDNRKIVDLPLNARNWLQLATLAAGAVTYPGTANLEGGNRQNIQMNLGGNRSANTNFILNGTDNNALFVPGALAFPPVDSLQEFKVETNNYTADSGRLGGAVVNAVIKSGTNAIHGTAYDFLRNRALNARNFFAAQSGPKPQFTRNQYGASVGGPVLPSKVFFFLNYEGNRQREARVVTRQVFTDAQKGGDFSASLGSQAGTDGQGRPVFAGQIFDPFSVRRLANNAAIRDPLPGNRIPLSRMNPVSKTIIDLVPSPNRTGALNYGTNLGDPLNIDTWVGRSDWIHGKDSVFFHIVFSDQDSITEPALGFPIDGGDTNFLLSEQRQMGAGWTRVITPTILNELRVGYARNVRVSNSVQLNDDINGKVGIPFPFLGPGLGGMSNIGIAGYTTLGSVAGIFTQYQNKYELADNFTVIRGPHTFKFGFQMLKKIFQNRGACQACRGVFNFNGVFTQQPGFNNTGNPVADFLFGTANTTNYDNVRNVTAIAQDLHLYVQDKWQVSPKLTLSLGLRYTHYPPSVVKQDSVTSVIFDQGYTNPRVVTGPNLAQSRVDYLKNVLLPFIPVIRASDVGLNRSLIKNTPENFGPRLGIAYRLSSNTVIRGGYGIFYGYPDQASVGLASNPPNLLGVSKASNTIDPTLLLNQSNFGDNPFNTSLPNPNWVGIRDVNFKYDFLQMYNLMVQREVRGWVLEIGFMGNHGSSIIVLPNLNDARPALPTDNSSPQSRRIVSPLLGNLPFISPQGFSTYNGLVLSAEKRYASGLSVLANYTWSRALGAAPPLNAGINNVAIQNPLNIAGEYGPLEFDVIHRAVFSYTYDLPFGKGKRYWSGLHPVANQILGDWQISGVTTLQGGFPTTPVLGLSLGKTFTNSRPNAIGDPNKTTREPHDWISSAAFAIPSNAEIAAGNFYGNAGRGSIRQPGLVNFDFSLMKNFVFTERLRAQFRTEFYNLTNTPFFGLPGALSTTFNTPTFGRITAAGDPRVIQLGLKVIF